MEAILFLAHTEEDGGLARPALEALAAARRLAADLGGAALTAGLVGPAARAVAVPRVLAVTGEEFAPPRYASDAAAIEALARASGAALIVGAATSRWMRAVPGAVQRLNGRTDTHVVNLSAGAGGVEVSRWFYRQRMEGSFRRSERPWAILIEPGSGPAPPAEASPAQQVEPVAVALPPLRTRLTGIRQMHQGQQTIRPDADLLLVAGAGWTKRQRDGRTHASEAGELILEFLARARASLGSSKSLVDLSGEGQAVLPFLTHLHQVGQTGSTPRHAKGLATCCHGEEPHVVGWRFIGERRAVNLDANCGWARGKADVVYVADAFEVLRCLNALLS